MPTKINPDFKPSDQVYKLLAVRFPELSFDRAKEFVGHELSEFQMYWEGTGKPKSNWHTTCLNWMKRAYEDRKDRMARNRTYGGQQQNAFEKVLNNIEGNAPQVAIINRPIHKPAPIPDMGTMTTDDALAELKRMTRRK